MQSLFSSQIGAIQLFPTFGEKGSRGFFRKKMQQCRSGLKEDEILGSFQHGSSIKLFKLVNFLCFWLLREIVTLWATRALSWSRVVNQNFSCLRNFQYFDIRAHFWSPGIFKNQNFCHQTENFLPIFDKSRNFWMMTWSDFSWPPWHLSIDLVKFCKNSHAVLKINF